MTSPRPRWQSLGWKLFLVLVLFASIPTFLMVTLSDFALRSAISDEIGKSAIEKLKVAHGINSIVADLARNTCMRVTLVPDLEGLSQIRNYDSLLSSATTQYRFAQFLDLLDDTVRTNSLFQSIYIVFDGVDYILSSEAGTSRRSDFADGTWLEGVLAPWGGAAGGGTFLPPHRLGGDKEVVISYLFPIPLYLTEVKGVVVINLREREFTRLINDLHQGGAGTVSIVDAQGNLISHGDQRRIGTPWGSPEATKAILKSDQSEGMLTLPGPTAEHLVTWYRPDQGGWTYIGDFSLEALTRNLGTVRLASAGASLVLILVCVLSSFFLSRRFFHPVRHLIREVNQRLGRQEDWEGNELTLLNGAFDILLKRETQLFLDMETQKRRHAEVWVGRALRGDHGPQDQGVPEGLVGTLWLGGLLAIDDYPHFVAAFPPEQREYLRSLVINMAEQAFLPEIRCLGTALDPREIALVLVTDEASGGPFADRVEEGFEALSSQATRVLGTSLTLCLGSRSPGPEHLARSWEEARALVHQRFLQGPGQWFWEENPAVVNPQPYFPLRVERSLVAALEARSPERVQFGITELRRTLRSRRDLGYDNVQMILHQMVGALVKYLVESRIDLTRLYGNGGDLHRTLADFETLEGALAWLESIFMGVIDQTSEATPDSGHVSAMVRFIRTNLHRDFGVEDVAESVGLSYSYARRVFEEAMGESIVVHTNALRIEEAKRLLAETEMTLDEVTDTVGYNNVQSFHRHFKKLVGSTPGAYRVRFRLSEASDSAI